MSSRSAVISSVGQASVESTASTAVATKYRIDAIGPSELCGSIAQRWGEVRDHSPKFASPYFDIEFTKAVCRVREDVEIAIAVDESDCIQAFFPFQRVAPRKAMPVGGRLSDLHAPIGEVPDPDGLIKQIMKSMDLTSYAFHAGLKTNGDLEAHEFEVLNSYFMDLSDGWDIYYDWARKNSVAIKRQGQKTRALEREIGPIRFEFDCQATDVLERLIELKRAKYQRSMTFDILGVPWAAELLREISKVRKPGFQGILSVLWAGDDLIAVHFGMLTGEILHYWFPVFEPKFSKYSPGTELMLRVAQEAVERNVSKVDLGFGDDPYKARFCNGRENVSCGRIGFSELGFEVAKRKYSLRKSLKQIPLKPVAKKLLRSVFPGYGQWNFK